MHFSPQAYKVKAPLLSCLDFYFHTYNKTTIKTNKPKSPGSIQAWDVRHSQQPSLSFLPSTDKEEDAPALCVAVNAAQPFLCAAGYNDGVVRLWDTRSNVQALCTSVIEAASLASNRKASVTTLQFVNASDATKQTSLAAYTTSQGHIGLVDLTSGSLQPLYQEEGASILSMATNSVGAVNQLFASTDREGVVFVGNY